MRPVLFLFVALSCAIDASAATTIASEAFTAADADRIQQLAISAISSSREPAVLSSAVSALAALKAVDKAASAGQACDALKTQLTVSDATILRHVIHATFSLKCTNVDVTFAKQVITQGLQEDNVAAIATAGQLIATLVEHGKAQWKDFNVKQAIDTLLSFAEKDGTFKPRATSDGNPLAAGYALEFLGNAYSSASEEQKRKIKSAGDAVETLLDIGAGDDDDAISFRGSASRTGLQVTSQVLRGVLSMLKAIPSIKVDPVCSPWVTFCFLFFLTRLLSYRSISSESAHGSLRTDIRPRWKMPQICFGPLTL